MPRGWQMPDIPFSLFWDSWNSGKGLFLRCPYLFVNRCSCSLSCKTKFGNLQSGSEGEASVDKVLSRVSVSSRMTRATSLKSGNPLSPFLPQYTPSLCVGPDTFSWTCQVNLFVLVRLSYGFATCGYSSVMCNVRNNSESMLFSVKFSWHFPSSIPFPNFLEIFPLCLPFLRSWVSTTWGKKSPLNLRALKHSWGCRAFLGFLYGEVSFWWGLMGACLYQMCHLLLWWGWQVEGKSRGELEKLVVWIGSERPCR